MSSGVVVFHLKDVFYGKHHRSNFISPATRSGRRITNPNTNIVNPNHNRRSSQKRSPSKKDAFPTKEAIASKPKSKPKLDAKNITASNLVMGQVKILRRGEVLTSSPPSPPTKSAPASNKFSRVNIVDEPHTPKPADRMMDPPPERHLLQKQIRFSDCYAGSAIDVSSPPPSSLPVPAFFRKKLENSSTGTTTGTTVDATNNLLKLLQLDMS